MIEREFDRDSPEMARRVMTQLCPGEQSRRQVLAQLLRSISEAEKLAPNSWSVTLFDNGFRLNVGPVEVYTLAENEVRLLLFGTLPNDVAENLIKPIAYRSVSQPQYCFTGSIRQFSRLSELLEQPHYAFVRNAAVTATGKPRRSSFARFHSPGLHAYAKELVDA
jgi:hypothetical protein